VLILQRDIVGEMIYLADEQYSCPQTAWCFYLGHPVSLNTVKMVIVILAFYLCRKFFIISKQSSFNDFPTMVGTCLLLPSLFTHSSTAVLSLKLFAMWQEK
jgi:hypothetical protein